MTQSTVIERDSTAISRTLHPLRDGRLGLYAWQEEAFSAWEASGHRGIVEAVTGAGKTRLGIAAISAALREGRQALLLVPTIELLNQWFAEIRSLLPWAVVGRMGDQHRDDFLHHQVIVSTVQSAVAVMRTSLTADLPGSNGRLLVADEVHRLAAERFATVLDPRCDWRLGLSATYERPDGQHLEHLDPYFGGVVHKLWYDRAQSDHLIAPFDIALVGVSLPPVEHAQYEKHSAVIRSSHQTLRGYLPEANVTGSQFIAIVAGWAAEEAMTARTAIARRYMAAVTARQRLLGQSRAKLEQLDLLRPALQAARSTLLFSLTQDGATLASDRVAGLGIAATSVYADVNRTERASRMQRFRDGAVSVLSAPRVLDEGVDVPEAELGIVLAASRNKRQLVQRLGRVIRRKRDGRAGKLVFFYAIDTIEDPDISGDQHLNEILPHARDLGWFTLPGEADGLLTFLENPPPELLPPAPLAGPTPKVAPRITAPAPIRFGARPGVSDDSGDVGPAPAALPEPIPRPGPVPLPGPGPEPVLDEPADWDGEIPELLRGKVTLDRDLTKFYLKQIRAFPLLSAEEEVELGQQIEVGVLAQEKLDLGAYALRRERRELEELVQRGAHAHRRFTCANLRLVVSIAKRHMGRPGTNDFLDVIQEGNLGLARAIQMWDFKLGHKFSTYATWWIRQAITRALADTSRTIRLPVHLVERLSIARRAFAEAMDRGSSEEAARAAMAAKLETDEADVKRLFSWDRPPQSLHDERWLIGPGDAALTDLGGVIVDEFAEEVDRDLLATERRVALARILSVLDEREERVLCMRLGIAVDAEYDPVPEPAPMTLDAIGEVFGVTRERIRQIEKQAKLKIRERWTSAQLRYLLQP